MATSLMNDVNILNDFYRTGHTVLYLCYGMYTQKEEADRKKIQTHLVQYGGQNL